MQRGTAPVFVVFGLLVIAVLAGFLFYKFKNPSQMQEISLVKPTNALSIFSSQEFNFTFQYPAKNLTVKNDSEEEFNKRGNGDFRKNFRGYVMYEPGKVLGAVTVLGKDGSFDLVPFSVWVFDNPQELTSSQWFEKYWFYPYLWGVFAEPDKGHIRPDKIATISGQTVKYSVVSYQQGSPKFILISQNQQMYLLRVIGDEGEKILESFKFLK